MSDAGASASGSASDIKTPITWNDNLETYFCETAEKAECLSWVHKRGEELYSHRKTFIDMPVIVLSSLVGFCSVGNTTIFPGMQSFSSILLGCLSLFVSTLKITGSYFGWEKRAEGHRFSSIHYAKLYRFLKVELSLPRAERMSPQNLLKYCKDQYDRLQEVSPLIPALIAREFKEKFSVYTNISKPEEMNGLSAVTACEEDATIVVTTPTDMGFTQTLPQKPPPAAPAPHPSATVVTSMVESMAARRNSAFSLIAPNVLNANTNIYDFAGTKQSD